jgi:hypothetical protein
MAVTVVKDQSRYAALLQKRLGIDSSRFKSDMLNQERAFSIACQLRYPESVGITSKDLMLGVARQCAPKLKSVSSSILHLIDEPRPQRPFPSEEGKRRADILLKGKRGYLKPINGAAAFGVARITLEKTKTLLIQSKDRRLINKLGNINPRKTEIFDTIKDSDESIRIVPRTGLKFNRINLGKFFDLLEIFIGAPYSEELREKIGRDKFVWGATMFEEEVKTPLISGPNGDSTWEIRVINQRLGGEIQLIPSDLFSLKISSL